MCTVFLKYDDPHSDKKFSEIELLFTPSLHVNSHVTPQQFVRMPTKRPRTEWYSWFSGNFWSEVVSSYLRYTAIQGHGFVYFTRLLSVPISIRVVSVIEVIFNSKF